ncbi:UvrD-helicase domain-containing protein [Comamonas sp. B21-038]|uniref:UvrD-helicase domain-containing protein n=1 Tax=Comamonas sp. B21-038 TaxID=2918299 RepID=UPI001EFA935B|nr:UvrD-helicase domain-containing protein [Comamonas sp. B21-038]ULR90339.1 AAA family ATPase [Comamonas sp. B21-038]
MSLKPKVALSQDFLLQLSKLPKNVQSKVMQWTIKFQVDPKSPGINYENILGARDANLKSVRLDSDWRGIVFKPSSGDVYVLLYVAHHDDAYRWAENRKLAVNPVTGAMQMVLIQSVEEAAPADEAAGPVESGPANSFPLFKTLQDRELLSLGVPQEMLDVVRAIASDRQLDALQAQLPVEAYEGLFLVAAGDTVSQVLSARETRVDRDIDTQNFAAALETAESQSRFVIVDDDEAMLAIMNAPLAQWRVFLHPTQKKLADGDRTGAVRVLGGAGTGKTVLAMHRAKWLAENRTPEGQKVLFTTFTKNLASDIEQNLRTLCNKSTLEKIEVRNFDAWVHGFMRSHKLEHRIVYDRKQDGALQAWESAMAVRDTTLDLPKDFYEKELEQVILAQGITTRDEYRIARRTGREGILSRGKRDAIWPVFEEYRGQLSSRKLKEVDDAYREVAAMLASGEAQRPAYVSILIDETQDFGEQALKLLRVMIEPRANDLFFVGDGHQRIYSRNKAAMSKCGIDIRGRARKLYLNYRTTDEIRRQAVALLEGCDVDDLDGGQDEALRYKSLSHGPVPSVYEAEGLEAAAAQVIVLLKSGQQALSEQDAWTVCVIAPSEKIRETLAQQVTAAGFSCVTITAQSNHADSRGVVHFATMHRAKGLEFDSVVVVAPEAYFGDPEQTGNQRKLMYVALTRAKRTAALIRIS